MKGTLKLEKLLTLIDKYFVDWLFLPRITYSDIIEIFILAFLIYQLIIWIRNTRGWNLLRGLILLCVFFLVAYILQMDVILDLAGRAINIGLIFIIIVFQPELRKGLEQLGHRNVLSWLFPFDTSKGDEEYFTSQTIHEIINACMEMSRQNTGALIVIQRRESLGEYESTGIPIDAVVSAQLLMNIFEHNTPLHDGAVIIKNGRIDSATCYLPLSDNMMLSKELGTRHRAAVGISEISDSLTIVVSEETGAISVAMAGRLYRNLDKEQLLSHLIANQTKAHERTGKRIRGRVRK